MKLYSQVGASIAEVLASAMRSAMVAVVVAFLPGTVSLSAAEVTKSPATGTVAIQLRPQDFARVLAPFFQEHCVGCHGPKKQKGKLRLDTLSGDLTAKAEEVATWKTVIEQLETEEMPPKDEPRPKRDETDRVVRWVRAGLAAAGQLTGADDMAFPGKGNYVNHDSLFNRPSTAAPATPARIWRLSPFGYREFVDDLTGGRLIVQGGPSVRAKMMPIVVTPFGLTSDPGFRDYAFRYKVSGSETQQLAMNAKIVLDVMLKKRPPKSQPPRALAVIAEAGTAPTAEQVRVAVTYFFQQVLYRDPTEEEQRRFSTFVTTSIARLGNREGLIHGLAPVMLEPEAIFRTEFGQGQPDKFGRVLLAPLELAMAISYALTDERPSAGLLTAARSGKLATREDARREVTRMLGDPSIEKPRILRFFQEYFEYHKAPEVFKDAHLLKEAGIDGRYVPESLVHDTDLLVLRILESDRDVLRQLLTTNLSYVSEHDAAKWMKSKDRRGQGGKRKSEQATHPFGKKPGQNEAYRHYNFDPAKWSVNMPLTLPAEQRAGILTQPSWLIAHSANTENHAIHRGKWVRERLIGGHIPDTPITVEAKLPEEPDRTLRDRMRVTRVEYCFKCHQAMDPLGLSFENYDHVGQFRTTELGKPVDTTGEIVASGDPKLDGKITNALEMIRKLADSERVHQVFVRHAFRYWMGRNETLDDAPTLQAAYKAYCDSHGSMRALIASLLTSDSFLYRTHAAAPGTPTARQ